MTHLPAACLLFPGGCVNDIWHQGARRTAVIFLMDAQGRVGMIRLPLNGDRHNDD